MHAAGAQSNPRVAPFGSAFSARYDPAITFETGDLVRIRETGAQVFVGFRVLLGRGVNRREGNRRMLHW